MDRNWLQYHAKKKQRMSQLPNLLHTLLLLVSLSTAPVANGLIAKMKIVDPAATTQAPYAAATNHEHVDYNLKPSVPHSNFTGPSEMKRLVGECFTTNSDNNQYEYRFCPFDNVTQHDIQASWNAYNGVLGIWHSWEVADGRLDQQSFKEGDSCGSYNREVKVLFTCGKTDELAKPTEPNPCKYELEFATPHACNKSMHLSNILSGESKAALKVLDDELYDEEVTAAGYRKKQRKLLKRAGVLPSRNEPPRPTPPPSTPAPPTPPPYVWKSDATKLQECEDDKTNIKRDANKLNETVAHLTAQLKALSEKLEELGVSSNDVLEHAAAAKTAKRAPDLSGETCVDTAGASCVDWFNAGECTSNPAFMLENCRKSCGDCGEAVAEVAAAAADQHLKSTLVDVGAADATAVEGGDVVAAASDLAGKDVEETLEGVDAAAAAAVEGGDVVAAASDLEGKDVEETLEGADASAAAAVGGGDVVAAASNLEGNDVEKMQGDGSNKKKKPAAAPTPPSDGGHRDDKTVLVTETKQVTPADVDAAAAAAADVAAAHPEMM